MALTISIEGKGVIANCDALTNDTGGTGTGDWSEQGGGTMSLTTDVYLYGSSSIAGKYASKSGLQQFDIGSGNELDFGSGGSEEDQFIYIWVNLSTFGVLNTLANKGLAVRVSSSSPGTSNYKDFVIAGSNGTNGWTGGWKLFVIDPTMTASASSGTCDLASIRTIGVWIDTASSVRAESLFIDQIAVGKGLRITGTSTQGWKDVVDYCTDFSNRAWGMMQEQDGIYYAFGKLFIGDTSQGANVSFADSGRVIQFGTSQYYESSAWKSTFPADGAGIVVEDHASYTTTLSDGVIVGTDNGRSGSTIIGNSDQNIFLDLYGGNNTGSVTTLYGTVLKSLEGALNSGDDSDHKFLGVSFLKCSQFNPVGAPVIRNCTFAETSDVDSALLWNENIDIQASSFIANTTGAGLEHPSAAGTPYTHTSLIFAGNTYDVLNSSGSAITIGNSGTPTSDGSTSEGSSVTFQNNVTIEVKNVVVGSVVRMSTIDGNGDESTNLINEIATGTSVSDSVNYAGLDYTAVVIVVRSSSGATKYLPYRATDAISTSGISHTANQVEDTIAT